MSRNWTQPRPPSSPLITCSHLPDSLKSWIKQWQFYHNSFGMDEYSWFKATNLLNWKTTVHSVHLDTWKRHIPLSSSHLVTMADSCADTFLFEEAYISLLHIRCAHNQESTCLARTNNVPPKTELLAVWLSWNITENVVFSVKFSQPVFIHTWRINQLNLQAKVHYSTCEIIVSVKQQI